MSYIGLSIVIFALTDKSRLIDQYVTVALYSVIVSLAEPS